MEPEQHSPPKVAAWLIAHLFPDRGMYSTLGDLEQVYHRIAAEHTVRRARMWYWGQVVRALPHYTLDALRWSGIMYKNYLKLALRTLGRHRGYTVINVVGLAIGLACALSIFLWVQDEVRYDRFHEKATELYRVAQDYGNQRLNWALPFPAGPAFREQVPSIAEVTRYSPGRRGMVVRYSEVSFLETAYAAVDPSFFEVFTFPFIEGGASDAIANPSGLVLTKTSAQKYFADESPLGKEVLINSEHVLTVVGVIEDVPGHSTLQFDILVPFALLEELGMAEVSWQSNWVQTFVHLPQVESLGRVGEQMAAVMHANLDRPALQGVALTPLLSIHPATPSFVYVYIFSLLAVFILLVACINFMNLSTAQATRRAKEVGMRKVVGAPRRSLIAQFLGESVLLAVLALALAMALVASLLDPLNTLLGKDLHLHMLLDGPFLIGMGVITMVTGLFAGSYPAFYLSAFRPAHVLKGAVQRGGTRGHLRKALVVFQFSISIFLLIGTFVIHSQLQYLRTKDVGYDKEQVVYINLPNAEVRAAYATLKGELLATAAVQAVTGAQVNPSRIGWNSYAHWEGRESDDRVAVNHNRIAYDYLETLGLELADGRGFSEAFPGDVSAEGRGSFVVNEEAARLMGGSSVLGREFTLGSTTGSIIGVIKDFHFLSLHSEIKPLAFVLAPDQMRYAIVRLAPDRIAASMQVVEEVWNQVMAGQPFEYQFLNEEVERMYRTESRLADVLTYFAVLAVLIAMLGLLGLVAYTMQERRKEVAVRKVLGASEYKITFLLCKEFLLLVGVANVLVWPLAQYVLGEWLTNFAYRIPLGWEIFVGVGLLALGITIATVSFHAIKAALANPIIALRYE